MNPKIEQLLSSALHKTEADGRPIPHNRWQRILSSGVRSVVSAPHKSIWMEWEYGTWIGSFAGYDEVGRQLGEANVVPQYLAKPLADKWRPFKGEGSRKGHPFNVDAFREMSQCWDDLLSDTVAFRNLYCQLYQHPKEQPLSARDLYIITSIAVSIPAFLLRRSNSPVQDGALDRRAAAAFKVLGGMYAATNRMLSQANPMLMQDELDIDEFLQYIEDEGLLLAPEARACAAPVKMIKQILSTALYENTEENVQKISHLGADVESAFVYGTLCVRIDLIVLLYWQGLKYYLKSLLDNPDVSNEVKEVLVQEYELDIENPHPLSAYYNVVQQVLNPLDATEAESQFILSLPMTDSIENDKNNTSIEMIGENCYQLECAMRVFVQQHQIKLNKVLQRSTQKISKGDWSPAPGSHFLKALFSMDARLTKNISL